MLDYTRRIDQIQSTMDKSGFGTSMLASDNVRGHLANTSLIQSPRGHTTGSGNAQHYMLACINNSQAQLCKNLVNITYAVPLVLNFI